MSNFTMHPATHPDDYANMDTQQLRDRFMIQDLFKTGEACWHYCGDDRLLLAGVCPAEPIALVVSKELGPEPLLERREMGIVNLGDTGEVKVGETTYTLEPDDGLYVGNGAGEVILSGKNAKFYCTFAPAHQSYPSRHIKIEDTEPIELGAQETSNERTIYLYIAPGVTESCQLMMRITKLKSGSVWNTMPCHLHTRRMEVYLYCKIPDDQMIVHLMGKPNKTRNLIMRNEEAVIAPNWSIHTAAGMQNYAFLWCMVGENQDFQDMHAVATNELF